MHSVSFTSPKVCWCLTSAAHLKLLWALWLTRFCAQRCISCTHADAASQETNPKFQEGRSEWWGVRQWTGGTWPTGHLLGLKAHLQCFEPKFHEQKQTGAVPLQADCTEQSKNRSQGVAGEVHLRSLPFPSSFFVEGEQCQSSGAILLAVNTVQSPDPVVIRCTQH